MTIKLQHVTRFQLAAITVAAGLGCCCEVSATSLPTKTFLARALRSFDSTPDSISFHEELAPLTSHNGIIIRFEWLQNIAKQGLAESKSGRFQAI